ncbi:MAG: protein-L-isoaspartate O-methyltransferase family protein [Methylovirgula sp.]
MDQEVELQIIRRTYAKQIMHIARVSDPRLEEALATLRREDFLPPAPWQIMRMPVGYQLTPVDDPLYLYQDAPVAIVPEKRLNNGQPSFLTFLISAGELQAGEHAIHIGTGTGYYTAVIGHLIGPTGHVIGIEIEPELASVARSNLARFPHIEVIEGNGSHMPFEPADVIYVNAGVSRPADVWLDALRPNGRLVLPLATSFTTDDGHAMTRGALFIIKRRDETYEARALSSTLIYPCMGLRDETSEKVLATALAKPKNDMAKVKRLYRTDDVPEEHCWLRAPGWCLAYE